MQELVGRVAVITGASRGLGKFLATRLGAEGCRLVICSRDQQEIDCARAEIEEQTGTKVVGVHADITVEQDVRAMVDRAVSEFSTIDFLVCNAGLVGSATSIHDFELADWKRIVDVNLFGYFLCVREVSRIMIQNGCGNIVQINSRTGKRGTANNSAYAASKGGGIVLTQSLSAELAKHNIRVNSICVGSLFESELWQDFLFEDYAKRYGLTIEQVKERYLQVIPLNRGCDYEDVGNLATFLLSDRSSYMTGQAINLTGGEVVW
jgi:sorbitol-6-phosphate 2-dehydrogenase